MGLTTGRQEKVTQLLRKEYGKNLTNLVLIGSRYTSKKWSNYEQYLDTKTGHTLFINLDGELDSIKVSEKPNARHMRKYEQKQKRAEARAERKAERETKAKAPKVHNVKAAKKVNMGKDVLPHTKGWTPDEEARIKAIMEEKGCARNNAKRHLLNEKAIKEADTVKA